MLYYSVAVLFFVFGEVMLSIKAAISPSLVLYMSQLTLNRASSAAKLCLAAFFSIASAVLFSRL